MLVDQADVWNTVQLALVRFSSRGYTYLFVRFFRTPQKFGITQQVRSLKDELAKFARATRDVSVG